MSLFTPNEATEPAEEHVAYISFDKVDKERVHVYLVHGWDPLDVGRLRKVRAHCEELGYSNVKIVQFYQWSKVVDEICTAKAENPQTKTLLLGYSAGANSVTHMVNQLHDDHQIDVDRVFYLAGIMLIDNPYTRPEYVGKIIHIRDGGFIIPGMNLTGADNYRFTDVWHFGSPTHPSTLGLLERELQSLAEASP